VPSHFTHFKEKESCTRICIIFLGSFATQNLEHGLRSTFNVAGYFGISYGSKSVEVLPATGREGPVDGNGIVLPFL
jgi:hypothetical protein